MGDPGWKVLAVLAAAQFLMVLDQAVMNVSISQLVGGLPHRRHHDPGRHHALLAGDGGVHDPGGKLGDIWGRRRAFTHRPRDLRRAARC